MTYQELMQQALDALTAYDGTNGASQRKRVLAALRERLAQPEQDYRTRHDRGCYKCGSHYCPADCPMPTHLAPQQPQMQPCAGRNCGSTNPNLHSAECFEDYEKSTGMSKWHGPVGCKRWCGSLAVRRQASRSCSSLKVAWSETSVIEKNPAQRPGKAAEAAWRQLAIRLSL